MVFSFSDLAFMGAVTVAGYDPDAQAYITAVETADGQALETGVRDAINAFVVGCKADGIWNAIKASCIMAGARTLAGALVPLVGAAPTNFNFVSGDYNRKTGLVGNGNGLGSGTKYLNSNRAGDADPQNNRHVSAYASTVATYVMIGSGSSTGRTQLGEGSVRLASNSPIGAGAISSGTFTGGSRESASTMIRRINGASVSDSVNSETPPSLNYAVFARNTSTGIDFYADHRLAFYSIGESLDLALLDARVTTLINAYAAAIP